VPFRFSFPILVLPILTLFAAQNVGAQGKPEKDRIRIGYAARAVTHSIPFVTNEAGFFRDEGLQVEVVRTAGAVSPMVILILPPCRRFY
jgi:ABC-type nitrate/sulfonate/bicarbonate transport system substrate-binding protein